MLAKFVQTLLLVALPIQGFAYEERRGDAESFAYLIAWLIFWMGPTYAFGHWVGETWGFKGTGLDKPIEPMTNLITKGEKLHHRISTVFSYPVHALERPWKDAKPETYSMTSYLCGIGNLLWGIVMCVLVILYLLWRALVYLVFMGVGLPLITIWIIYAFGGFMLLGGFEIGVTKGRANWERRNAHKEEGDEAEDDF